MISLLRFAHMPPAGRPALPPAGTLRSKSLVGPAEKDFAGPVAPQLAAERAAHDDVVLRERRHVRGHIAAAPLAADDPGVGSGAFPGEERSHDLISLGAARGYGQAGLLWKAGEAQGIVELGGGSR